MREQWRYYRTLYFRQLEEVCRRRNFAVPKYYYAVQID